MDTADLLLTIWALIGALGGAVAGTLVYKLHLGLPFYSGTLVSALVGAIAVVIVLDRYRTT